jgi:glycosyltransferase involved in cell wall biosynthesis
MAAERRRLILMTADTVGGVWHHAVELVSALGAHGVRVALATMGAPLTPSQRAQIARVPTASLHESAYRLEWMPDPWTDVERAGAWLLRLSQEMRPDLVHLNQFAFGALPFAAPKLVVAHSCVLSWWRAVRGAPAPREWNRYGGAVGQGLAGATLVAAPTRAMLRGLHEDYAYGGDGVVIPNGRSAAAYKPGPKAPMILAAGRLWDEAKNLSALEAIAADLPWPVRVAGSTVQPWGGTRMTSGVEVLGHLDPDALARELGRASIYALPARYEPFGLSVLEAALSGCALVLGDIPSLREIWGNAALYVKPDDHVRLRQCLHRLIADGELREHFARAALHRALAFTPERMAQGYLAAYTAASSASRAPRGGIHESTAGAGACAS